MVAAGGLAGRDGEDDGEDGDDDDGRAESHGVGVHNAGTFGGSHPTIDVCA